MNMLRAAFVAGVLTLAHGLGSPGQQVIFPAPLTHGPVVGAVTPTSAAVFIRTGVPITGTVRLTPGAGPHINTPFVTDNSNDFTAIVPVSGLSPLVTYAVTVLTSADQQGPTWPPVTTFKAFPPSTSTAPITVVYLTDFQGPKGHPKEPTDVFRLAAMENPDVVLIGGDFDHSNPGAGFSANTAPNIVANSYRAMYKGLYDPAQMPEFVSQILNKTAIAHMWDDHDFGANNQDKDYRWRSVAYQVFKEFIPTYPLPAPATNGLWQRFSYAYVDFFLVDTRSQRSDDSRPDDAGKSMLDGNGLGTAGQLQWLKDGLRTSTAAWKILLMPTPFNPTVVKRSSTPLSGQDTWTGFQTERQNLMNHIAAQGIKNVVMIAGDLHGGALDDGTNSGVIEMVVPPPNFTPGSLELCYSSDIRGTWSHGMYYSKKPKTCNGYGTVRVTPNQIGLQVKDETGLVKLHLDMPKK